MGAWVPILLVISWCLTLVLIVVVLQLRSSTSSKLAQMEKVIKQLDAKIRQHDADIASLRDQIQHQEPVSPLAAFITAAASAVAGMKMGKAMLPAIGLAAFKTLSSHLIPRLGRKQKALPK